MATINYRFSDGHYEEIEVSEEFAKEYALIERETQLEEWRYKWRCRKKLVSMDALTERGCQFESGNESTEDIIIRNEMEKSLRRVIYDFFTPSQIELLLIDSNLLDRIKFKSMERKAKANDEKKEQKALPEELREPFLVALNTDRFFKAFCLTAMFAGLRPGEVIGLKWRDIDFENGTLSVVRGMTVEPEFDAEGNIVKRRTVIGKTKTAGSVRTNPIPKLLIHALTEWREHRIAQQSETGYSLAENDDFVFGTNEGELRTYSGTKKMFDRFLKRNHLDGKGIHFYELRHTFSNTLFEQNTNPRVVQALMGHRKIETTMIYNTVRDNKYLEGRLVSLTVVMELREKLWKNPKPNVNITAYLNVNKANKELRRR